MKSEKIKT